MRPYLIPPTRYLSGTSYRFRNKTLHHRDVLVIEETPGHLALAGDEPHRVVRERIRDILDRAVSSHRLVVLKRSPDVVLALVLELQPDVQSPDELSLEEIVRDYQQRLSFRTRSRWSLGLAPKAESVLDMQQYAHARRSTTGQQPPCRQIVFHFSEISVGLGDRLVGLASALVLARALGAEVVLDEPFLPELFTTRHIPAESRAAPACDLDYLDSQYRYVEVLRATDFSEFGPVAHVIGNECFHYSLYGNPRVRHRLTDFDADLREAYREIFRTVMQPREHLLAEVARIMAGGGSRQWVGVQLRTGMIAHEVPLVSRTDVKRFCERIVDALPGGVDQYMAFITADNADMAALAKQHLASLGLEGITLDGPVLHISYPEHQESQLAHIKLFADLFVLSRCDRLFFTLHSNFGRLAYLMGSPESAYGYYGRNCDLLPLEDAYAVSDKHLLYNDCVISSMGGFFRFRYHDERQGWRSIAALARAVTGFALTLIADAFRWDRLRSISIAERFVGALFASESPEDP